MGQAELDGAPAPASASEASEGGGGVAAPTLLLRRRLLALAGVGDGWPATASGAFGASGASGAADVDGRFQDKVAELIDADLDAQNCVEALQLAATFGHRSRCPVIKLIQIGNVVKRDLPFPIFVAAPFTWGFLLLFIEFYRVLPSFTEFYRVLPSFTEFYWVLLGVTGFYLVLPGFTGFHLILSCFTGLRLVLLGFTEFYLILPDANGFSWVFLIFGCFFTESSTLFGVFLL